jgi:large conductance mechanosensitive channel
MHIDRYQKRATGFLKEFKTFALRGNVIDLAVAVVVGTAFNKIVSSLVDNIIMPLIGVATGGVDLKAFSTQVGEVSVNYGVFLQSVVDFLIIAWAIFVAIKVLRSLQKREDEKPEAEKEVEPSEEVKLLREIRDSLQK